MTTFSSSKIGKNSFVNIADVSDLFLEKIEINCGDNCNININGIDKLNSRLRIYTNNNANLSVGSNQLINGCVDIFMHEASNITIGDGCLFSDCLITSSDMHSILDLDTHKRINRAQDILIESNVWIGYEALILKGSKIGKGCVVGSRSTVTSSTPFEPNCIIVGNPAKIGRRNIFWDSSLLDAS